MAPSAYSRATTAKTSATTSSTTLRRPLRTAPTARHCSRSALTADGPFTQRPVRPYASPRRHAVCAREEDGREVGDMSPGTARTEGTGTAGAATGAAAAGAGAPPPRPVEREPGVRP